MKHRLIAVISVLSLLTFTSSAQSPTSAFDSLWHEFYSTQASIEHVNCGDLAKMDISNGLATIVIVDGDALELFESDEDFVKEFEVKYNHIGCLALDEQCMISYNHTVFRFLTQEYGRTWRRAIRKDAIGLKKWKWDKADP